MNSFYGVEDKIPNGLSFGSGPIIFNATTACKCGTCDGKGFIFAKKIQKDGQTRETTEKCLICNGYGALSI